MQDARMDSTAVDEACNPAPYGRACAGCARAKCKCFFRSDGSGCERCHRLAKPCEPSLAIGKRKARGPAADKRQPPDPPSSTRLEAKLDDLVSLLRAQAVEKQDQGSGSGSAGPSPGAETDISANLSTLVGSSQSGVSPAANLPGIVFDTSNHTVILGRPNDSQQISSNGQKQPVDSSVSDDISAHNIPLHIAEEQLDTFRTYFLPLCPFSHIPTTMSASKLREEKPFLWLVIMSLTSKSVAQQFAMEDTIWRIISQRVVAEHSESLDLLSGLMCFASWSHYFKKDRPFINQVVGLAITLGQEMDLHKKITPKGKPRGRTPTPSQQPRQQPQRTLEERRAILTLFCLSSSTWAAYKKSEPLRWTPYMDECVRVLVKARESDLDLLLVVQARCFVISNPLTCPGPEELMESEGWRARSGILVTALLSQLEDIAKDLPSHQAAYKIAQMTLHTTELTIREATLNQPRLTNQASSPNLQRLQDLDSLLYCVEKLNGLTKDMPVRQWVGVTVDLTAQYLHHLVVLFRLSTLIEPGWDLEEVRRRADLFEILDTASAIVRQVPASFGLVDAEGPRRGLFFLTPTVFDGIKAVFWNETPPELRTQVAQPSKDGYQMDSAADGVGDFLIPDEYYMALSKEPWLSDIFTTSWDFGQDAQMSFDTFAQV